MCIAIVKPSGIDLPSYEKLENAYSNNPHSIGVATHEKNDTISIVKNFQNFNEFRVFVKEDITKEDLVFIHFRYATHGTIDINNCQPFFISNNQSIINQKFAVLMHNGVFNLGKLEKNKSDTRTLVEMIYNKKFELDEDKLIRSNNKVAIMNTNGTYNIYGEWFNYKGCWFSNETYKYHASKIKENQNLCDRCGEFKENCLSTEVGYHFCQKCLKSKKVYIYKCECCGKESTDIICSTCSEKHNIQLNYWR